VSLDDWVSQARAGNARAFESLVAHFQPQLYHVAYYQLGNADEAMDACQDAAIDAWTAVRRFQGDAAAFRRWLFRIVVNACLDRARYDDRHPALGLDLERDGVPVDVPLPDPGMTPEQYAENGDLRTLLEACLSQLSSEHRTLILLDQLGLSYPEMAEVTDAELGTVKSRLSRARARMRELLLAEGGPEAERMRRPPRSVGQEP
jgi:RNA polymerase sigma-70 factor (ECF subfamily)